MLEATNWYVPSARLFDPQVGNEVVVLYGNLWISSKVAEILQLSDVYAPRSSPVIRDSAATQIVRVRFNSNAGAPPLISTVNVHMYYSDLVLHVARGLSRLLGICGRNAEASRFQMIIDSSRWVCPDCAARLAVFPVLHHMICAYVGPSYNFPGDRQRFRCPKCERRIISNDLACEIVATSWRCPRCGKETVMPPSTIARPDAPAQSD